LTLSEIDRFLSVAGRHELLYLIAFVIGARLGELGQLLWSDVHENEADPYIQLRSETTKNGKGRVQFLTREAAGMLKNARALSRIDRVFSQMPSRHTVNKHLELASIPKMTSDGRACFHSLRHSFTTTIAKMTKDARLAQRMADHADITTTQGYMHTEQSEHAAVMTEFPSVRADTTSERAVVGGKTGQFVSNEVPAKSNENGTQMAINESLSAVQSTLVQGREIMEPGGIEPPSRDSQQYASTSVVICLISTLHREMTPCASIQPLETSSPTPQETPGIDQPENRDHGPYQTSSP
jgi:Phage integrase family